MEVKSFGPVVDKQPSPEQFHLKMGDLISTIVEKYNPHNKRHSTPFIHIGKGDQEIIITRDRRFDISTRSGEPIPVGDWKSRYTVITHNGFREIQVDHSSHDAGKPNLPDVGISDNLSWAWVAPERYENDGYSVKDGTLKIGEFVFHENGTAFRWGKPIEGSKLTDIEYSDEEIGHIAKSLIEPDKELPATPVDMNKHMQLADDVLAIINVVPSNPSSGVR